MHVADIRDQFPFFVENTTAYLDSAASSLVCADAIAAVNNYYATSGANIHRGLYALSENATKAYETARAHVAQFLNANSNEIVFTAGTTASLNMLAHSLTESLGPGDVVVLTRLEHHANLVPWQQLAKKQGFTLRFIELKDGALDMQSMKECIDERVKIVSVAYVSNVLGTVLPIKDIVSHAKTVGAATIVDAAQAAAHIPIDVQDLACDFLVFSGHKVYGPSGVGVLYGRAEMLETLPPVLFGGEMVSAVSYEDASFVPVPHRFEAGTPNIAGAIGLGAALCWLSGMDMKKVGAHTREMHAYLRSKLSEQDDIHVYGPVDGTSVVSFNLKDAHPHDVAELLGKQEVAVRAGTHCAMPLMTYLGIPATVRASVGVYTTKDDIDKLIDALKEVQNIYG